MKKHLSWLLAALTAVLLLTGCAQSSPSLTGKTVTASIDEIGTVTLESLTAIENAEAQYAGLSQEEKALVTNYHVLTAARKTYEELALMEKATAAIDAVAEVVYIIDSYSFEMKPEDFIDSTEEGIAQEIAWMEEEGYTVSVSEDGSLYTITAPESTAIYKEDYPVFREMLPTLQALKDAGLYDRLAAREAEYLELAIPAAVDLLVEVLHTDYSYDPPEDFVAQMKELVHAFPEHEDMDELRTHCSTYYSNLGHEARDAGDYDRAIALYTEGLPYDVNGFIPDYIMRCYDAVLEEQIALLRAEIDRGDDSTGAPLKNSAIINTYHNALNSLEAMDSEFKEMDSYQRFHDKLTKDLDDFMAELLPENGEKLENTMTASPAFPRFYAKYELVAGDTDVLFKVYNRNAPEEYMLVYVYKNSSCPLALPAGTFKVHCATGDTWYGMEEMFGDTTQYYNFSKNETTFGIPVGEYVMSYSVQGPVRAPFVINGERNPALAAITADDF